MKALTGMNTADTRRHGIDGRPGSASMAAMSWMVISAWMSRRGAGWDTACMMSSFASLEPAPMAVSMPTTESDGGRADAEPKPEGRGGPVQPEPGPDLNASRVRFACKAWWRPSTGRTPRKKPGATK